MTIQLGTIHTMTVKEIVDDRYFLTKGAVEITIPPEGIDHFKVNDQLEVFVYKNRDEKICATTKLPSVIVGVYDWAKVVDVIPRLGVFVDIGTVTEVLVPKDELPTFQKAWPLPDDQLYVTLSLDKQERLICHVAKEAIFHDIIRMADNVNLNEKINGTIIRADKEGAAIFTEEGYRGFIHHSERESEPRLGELVSGRVIEVKENGTINVSLLPMKHERIDDDAEKVFAYIEKSDGVIPYSNQSDPDDIRKTFHMSKSAFKRALGKLMREGKIEQRDGQTWRI